MGVIVLVGAINAFYIFGGLLVVWAILVTVVGIHSAGFPRSRRQTGLVGATSVVLALAAIGSAIIEGALEDDEGSNAKAAAPSVPAGALPLAADPKGQLKFDKTTLDAKSGKVAIAMRNDSAVTHNVSLKGNGVDEHGKDVKGGATSVVSADLKPGRYTFYCSVPGHEAAGMKGTLTVK